MKENPSSKNQTKHVNTKYQFLIKFMEKGMAKINFVRSENNNRNNFRKSGKIAIYKPK